MSATLLLDGGAFLRLTAVGVVAASGAVEALARLGARLAAARDALAALRAALDALAALFGLAAAALAAAEAGSWRDAALRVALVFAAGAALVPLRTVLLRLALGALIRAAMRRAER